MPDQIGGKVLHRRSQVRGAMKRFKGAAEDDDEETAAYVIKTQQREVELTNKLHHPHIVELLASFDDAIDRGPPEALLVFELMPMNLLEALHQVPLWENCVSRSALQT